MRPAYALVIAPLANLRRAPAHGAELVSQRWYGEVLRLARRRGAWWRVAGWDGYAGWVRDWALRPVGARRARAWERRARALAWGDGVCVAVEGAGGALRLPWGARLGPPRRGPAGAAARWELSDGRRGRLLAGAVWAGRSVLGAAGRPPGPAPGPRAGGLRDRGPLCSSAGPAACRAVALARAVLGAPYLWGGTTPGGFDCSGLVQWAYALAGVVLPRDAGDQRRVLPPVVGDRARAGDLVFFARRGRVHHVALVSRPPWIIHAYGRVEEARLDERGRRELLPLVADLRRPPASGAAWARRPGGRS